MKQQQLQQKYLELQLIENQAKQIQKQLQAIETHVLELEYIRQSLEEVKNTEKEAELLVPISAGIFAHAKLKDTKKLVVNVGAGVAVAKDITQTQEMLARQVKELQNAFEELGEQLKKQTATSEKLMQELQTLAQ